MSEHDSESEVNLDLGKGEPDSDAEGSEESEQDGEIVDGSEEEQRGNGTVRDRTGNGFDSHACK